MADEAVLDAPIEGVDQNVDLGIDSNVTDDSTVDNNVDDHNIDGESPSGVALWKSVKEPLKGLDTKTAAAVRQAIFNDSQQKKKYPEGLEHVERTLEAIKQLSDDQENPDAVPFEEVIEQTLQERTFWRDFDTKFVSGDASIPAQMFAANSESAQKLTVAAMDEFAKANPDGYSSLIANVAVNYMDGAKLPLQFEILDMLLPKTSDDPGTQRIIAAFVAIKDTINGLRTMAQKPIVAASSAAKPAATNDPAADVEQRELRNKDIEWNRDIAPASNALAASEAIKIAGKNKFTAAEISSIQGKVKQEINARVEIDPKYQNSLKSYLRANNRAAYKQLVSSRHKSIIPGAVKRAVADVLDARGSNQPAKPAQQQRQQVQQQPADGEVRFEKIAGAPQSQNLKVDHNRTTNKMLLAGQAYIVGRKNPVRWDRK